MVLLISRKKSCTSWRWRRFVQFKFWTRAESKKSHDALDSVALPRVNNELSTSASKLKNLPYIRVLGWKGTVALMTWEIFPHTSTTAAPNTTTNEHEGNSTSSMDDCHRCCCKSSQRSNWIHSRELWRHQFRKIWPSDQSPRMPGGL